MAKYCCKGCGAESPVGIGYAVTAGTTFPKPDPKCPNLHQLTLTEFEKYVKDFYGKGGLYDMGATKSQIHKATNAYLATGAEFCGDSVDRERVRDIMIACFGLRFPN